MIPTPTERVSDEQLVKMIAEAEPYLPGTREVVLAFRELQQRRSSPPSDRGAVIEECAQQLEAGAEVAGRFPAGDGLPGEIERKFADMAKRTLQMAARKIRALSTPPKDSGNG